MFLQNRLFAGVAAVLIAGGLMIGCSTSPQAKEAKYLKRGQDLMAAKAYGRAILEFRNAARAMPGEAEPQYRLGVAYLRSGDPGSGVAALRKATELNPNHQDAQLALARLMAGASNDPKVVQDAVTRLQSFVAESAGNSALAESAGNSAATDALALAEWRLGKFDVAEKRLADALAKVPANLRGSVELARMKLIQKDTEGAEEVLQKAAAAAPKSQDARVALAELDVRLNRPEEAEREFRRVVQMNPKNGPALIGLASVEMAGKRMDEAEQTLRQVAALPEKQYKPQHALFLYQTGKHDAALAEFQKLARQDPDDRAARSLLVGAYLEMGKVPDAQAVLAAALKKNPKDTDALFQQSQLHWKLGQVAEAQNDLTKVLHFAPDSAPAHLALSEVFRAQGIGLREGQELNEALRLSPGLLQARVALAQNILPTDAKAALDVLDGAPKPQKNELALIIERNLVLLKLGRNKEVRAALDAVPRAGRPAEMVYQDAALRFMERDYSGSRAAAEEVLKQNPEDLRAVRLVVETYVVQKQNAQAGEKLAQIVEARPRSAPLQHLMGQWDLNVGNLAAARKAFEAAKAADPKYVQADLALSEVDIREKRMDAAKQRLTESVKAHPRNIAGLLMLASLEAESEERMDAILRYRAVLDIDGSNVAALNGLAHELTYTNLDEALPLAQRAVELAPGDAAVHDTLGWVFFRKAIYSSAVTQLKEAVAKQPTPRRQFHLGMAYLKTGEERLGQTMVQAALQKDPALARTEQGW